MQNISASSQMGHNSENNYSPSVPISVYREATAELQAAQIKLESLKVHNEQLIQQNQKLRREFEKVIQSATQLQETLNSSLLVTQVNQPQAPSFPNSQLRVDTFRDNSFNSDFEVDSPETSSASPSLPFSESKKIDPDSPEYLFTEETDRSRYSRTSNSTQVSELNGIWLVVAICLIVIAAFGAGYWVVRPILNQR
ncbi:MAG: hypothetical protein F6K23_24965 [Okeania sp. SIO2C9]|uniref:hypothetical protein n=1 Tax=Okeania sp. SIO2C9 TaxID=2607791 RepID=UPI0013C1CB89|nr:hypothetical protein [Okeania sp. SIO2C9]NEQ75998.1 hypothetical protein [Okeania sp. SIO2C9]